MWPRVGKTGTLPTSAGNPAWLWPFKMVSLEVPGNNSFGTAINRLIEGSISDVDEEVSPRTGFHKTEAGVELEENRWPWAYLSKLLGMPRYAGGEHFWRQEFLSEQIETMNQWKPYPQARKTQRLSGYVLVTLHTVDIVMHTYLPTAWTWPNY